MFFQMDLFQPPGSLQRFVFFVPSRYWPAAKKDFCCHTQAQQRFRAGGHCALGIGNDVCKELGGDKT